MFIFDKAPSHMKLPEDALDVQKMNVKDGGKQPLNFMKDKYMGWSGGEDGETERGVYVNGLVSEGLREILSEHEVRK